MINKTVDDVQVWTHKNFSGQSTKFKLGDYPDLEKEKDAATGKVKIKANDIDSIFVPDGVKVTAWSHPSYKGKKYGPYFGPNYIPKVDGMNDWDSMKIEEHEERYPKTTVEAWTFPNFEGNSAKFALGDYPDLNKEAIKANDIDSILIPEGVKVTAWSHPDYKATKYGPLYGPMLISKVAGMNDWDSMKVEPYKETLPDTRQINSLIKRYGPIVYFHPDEQYLMTNAESFIGGATLDGKPAKYQADSYHENTKSSFELMPGADRGGNLSTAKAYVHAKPGRGYIDLQFWFLYMYNGPGTANIRLLLNPPVVSQVLDLFGGSSDALDTTIADRPTSLEPFGEHEGDWEHVTLRIDSQTSELLKVYFSQHASGEWVEAADLERSGDNVVVYSSLNGHASYPGEGVNWSKHLKVPITPANKGEFFLRNDCAKGKSINCSDSGHYELVAAEGSNIKQPAWLEFPGRWGGHSDAKLTKATAEPILDRAFGIFASVLTRSHLTDLMWPLISFAEKQDGPGAPIEKTCWLGTETE